VYKPMADEYVFMDGTVSGLVEKWLSGALSV